MELKRLASNPYLRPGNLLIVPYGIETYDSYAGGSIRVLLIVPYGIETISSQIQTRSLVRF